MTHHGLAYADFIGRIGQDNSPPGGGRTIGYWIEFGSISERSVVLDLACSTGFSGRTIVAATRCRGFGIDMSQIAISTARARAERDNVEVEYRCGDAAHLPYDDGAFSHIVCGSAFGFFDRGRSVLDECSRVLAPGGRLCVATFYHLIPPPEDLIAKVNSVIGGSLRAGSTLESDSLFFASEFELVWQETSSLPHLSRETIAAGCYREICAAQTAALIDEEEFDSALGRHVFQRLIFNEYRRYQGVAIQLWRKPGE